VVYSGDMKNELYSVKRVDSGVYEVICRGVSLGTIRNNAGDDSFWSSARWTVDGVPASKHGYAGRNTGMKFSGFRYLESAANHIAIMASMQIIRLVNA